MNISLKKEKKLKTKTMEELEFGFIMKKKIKGFDRNNTVSIGDKHLTMDNKEDTSSIRIFIVDDVYEISPRENVYECTLKKFQFYGQTNNIARAQKN